MEEAVVSFALNQIRDLLVNEGRLLLGVGDEVRALETQMKEIKCLLCDADAKRHQNVSIFNWLTEIRDLTYSAEAAIETYAARLLSRRSRGGLRQAVIKYCCILKEFYPRHHVASEIAIIKSELARLMESMQAYNIKSIIDGDGSSTSADQRQTYERFEIGDCFVGMKKELKQLESLLVQDIQTRVISAWGMGGSGKTTIARNIYNQMKQTRCFDCFAWVCITQECRIRSVLEDILNQLISQKNGNVFTNLTDTQLMERLCEIQREKKCLVVLDDLWKLSHWNGLKHAFLVQDLQTKILITTRRQDVAEIGFSLELGLLKMEDAWELLKKKANILDFLFEEDIEKIGKDMVKKCGCLPLAVSVLGGVLRKKNSKKEWELVNKNINTFIYRDEKEIDGVLNLSYEDLPFYLKPCFLYMGIFKEDESIYVDILYRMWIAQGMVSYENIGDNEQSLMDIAELYLTELASRSIVQVECLDDAALKGKYLACKLHDVMRELCLKMGKKEEFGLQNLEYGGEEFSLLRKASSHLKIQYLKIIFHRESKVENEELVITSGDDIGKR